jgi:hypothetical protein
MRSSLSLGVAAFALGLGVGWPMWRAHAVGSNVCVSPNMAINLTLTSATIDGTADAALAQKINEAGDYALAVNDTDGFMASVADDEDPLSLIRMLVVVRQ